ncbi:hypothetical protein GJAV_G00241190 [Gymnothorax javanicus]|nr:hypothetical protein GJAV_G00241190 [Gymnothorax javanicus]
MASSKRDQVLRASKSLLICNNRIRACITELQKRKEGLDTKAAAKNRLTDPVSEECIPCKGKVALSGLRIPLMWKDSDHFSGKGSSRQVAVFCQLKIGAEVFDTEMVVVDRSATDICFEGVTFFTEARPQFELTLELYSCAMEDDASLVNTPKKLAKKFRNSLGKAAGKKLCPLVESGDPESFLQTHPIPASARFSLLAYTTLSLAQAEGSFQSHSLMVAQSAESSSWLPLYGSLCCRLVAQPECMTQEMMTGFLNQQQSVGSVSRCCTFYCVLKAGSLACYYSPEEIEAKLEPALTIPINKDTRIRTMEGQHRKGPHNLTIINPAMGQAAHAEVFTAESREELQAWIEAFRQHLYDQAEWLHCCTELMEIEAMSPRKPLLFQTRQADSVYNDLSIGSPGKFESLTDIIHNKIEETGGRFSLKSVLSPRRDEGYPSPNHSGPKKRRAPPPPTDKQPLATGSAGSPLKSASSTQNMTSFPKERLGSAPCDSLSSAPYPPKRSSEPQQQKPWKPATRTGRPSLDAKFSALIQQLQKTHGSSAHKPAPVQSRDSENQPPDRPPNPIPAPRHIRKSFREKMNPKGW